MDASILQLFTIEEILHRLSEKGASGALHIFTGREAANLFFQEGSIVGASKGLMDGEEVIPKILEWGEARLLWQEGERAPDSLKRLDVQFQAFLARQKVVSKLPASSKIPANKKPSDTSPMVPSLTARAAPTGPMTLNKTSDMGKSSADAPPLPPADLNKNLVPVPKSMSATKSITAGLREDDSFEEALMRKHQLALVAIGDTPSQLLRIIRSSNLVGRNPACDFTLNDSSISRQHCLLQIMDRGLHVKDLSTTNGTKVNGIKLTEGYVSVGDKLTIGHLDFLVEKDEQLPI